MVRPVLSAMHLSRPPSLAVIRFRESKRSTRVHPGLGLLTPPPRCSALSLPRLSANLDVRCALDQAVNELTDRKSWRGGLRVSLANGVTVEKALAKLKAASSKKARQEQKDR